MPRSFRVEGAEQLRVLAAELRIADKVLLTEMRRELRAGVQPIADDVKHEAGTFSQTIPAAITVRSQFTGRKVGVWLSAMRRKMPAGHEALPGLQAFGSRRNRGTIRHPSRQGPGFSQEGPWVNQPAHPQYWLPTINRGATRLRIAMLRVMRETSRAAGFDKP